MAVSLSSVEPLIRCGRNDLGPWVVVDHRRTIDDDARTLPRSLLIEKGRLFGHPLPKGSDGSWPTGSPDAIEAALVGQVLVALNPDDGIHKESEFVATCADALDHDQLGAGPNLDRPLSAVRVPRRGR